MAIAGITQHPWESTHLHCGLDQLVNHQPEVFDGVQLGPQDAGEDLLHLRRGGGDEWAPMFGKIKALGGEPTKW